MLKLHIHKPLEKLRGMLSESTALRTLFDVEDAEEALTKILYGYAEESPAFDEATAEHAVKDLPRALIALEDFDSDKETESTWRTRVVMSVLIQCLTLDADKTKSLSGRYESYLMQIEQVADNLRELASDNTRLNLRAIRTDIPPQRVNIKETGGLEIWETCFIVEAGG